MSNRTTLVWGIVLLTVGLLGVAGVLASLLGSPTYGVSREFSSDGQRIYCTGADVNGPIVRNVGGARMMGLGMMGDVACVECHGEDGRGGRVGMMFGDTEIPDIRYSALTTVRSEEGTSVPAWTEDDTRRSIRDGVEPNGQALKAPMPRWQMTAVQLNDTIDYLKELDAR